MALKGLVVICMHGLLEVISPFGQNPSNSLSIAGPMRRDSAAGTLEMGQTRHVLCTPCTARHT